MPILAFKPHQSHWVLLVFLFFICTMGVMSEFLQVPSSLKKVGSYQNPIPSNFLKTLKRISIKNRMGQFHFTTAPSKAGTMTWMLESPRKLPANPETLGKILSSLQNLQIRKAFAQDAINVANFSLDTPLLHIELENQNGEKLQINMGIVNPIDNSTYISLNQKKMIFQIDTLKYSLESFNLPDFVDSHIFSGRQENLMGLRIYKGKKEGQRPFLTFNRKDGQWLGSKDTVLSEEKGQDFIRNLLSVKGQVILDQRSVALEKLVQRYLSSPLYTLEIEEMGGIMKTYVISSIIAGPVPELKIENQTNIMVAASDRDHPYIISKDYLAHFNIQEHELKKANLNNLFY